MKTKRLSTITFRPTGEYRCPRKHEWLSFGDGCIVQAEADFETDQYDIYERIERPTRLGAWVLAVLIGLAGAVWIAILLLVGGSR